MAEAKYEPLRTDELQGMGIREKEGALRVRTETLREKLFEGVRVKYKVTKPGKAEVSGGLWPEQLPEEQRWVDYLISKQMWLGARGNLMREEHNFEEQRGAEAGEMRVGLALATMRGGASRGDLVVAEAVEVQEIEEKLRDKIVKGGGTDTLSHLNGMRVTWAEKMVEAMKKKWGI